MAKPSLAEMAGAAFQQGFGAVLAIEPDGEAVFYVDGREAACVIAAKKPDTEPACRWGGDRETLIRIFEGGRALESAYLSGRLKIAGDMSVMARLQLESSL